MLRIAFASNDRKTVNLHFGGAESLVLFDVSPGKADLVAFAAFAKAEQIGTDGRAGMTGTIHDKVLAKLDFVKHCHAVYAASIGASSIRRLMALNIQPIIVDTGHDIVDLLNEVSLGLVYGGLSWIERAKRQAEKMSPPPLAAACVESHPLLQSVDEL
jgi:nitrogen fixation protein NifX